MSYCPLKFSNKTIGSEVKQKEYSNSPIKSTVEKESDSLYLVMSEPWFSSAHTHMQTRSPQLSHRIKSLCDRYIVQGKGGKSGKKCSSHRAPQSEGEEAHHNQASTHKWVSGLQKLASSEVLCGLNDLQNH